MEPPRHNCKIVCHFKFEGRCFQMSRDDLMLPTSQSGDIHEDDESPDGRTHYARSSVRIGRRLRAAAVPGLQLRLHFCQKFKYCDDPGLQQCQKILPIIAKHNSSGTIKSFAGFLFISLISNQ